MEARNDTTALLGGLGEIAHAYDAVLCDVWGVVHNGVRVHAGAVEALARFRSRGGAAILVSNAPRPGDFVQAMLDRMGVERGAYDAIVTSGDVTRALLRERAGQKLHHIGPERDLGIFDDLGLPLAIPQEAALICCTGLDDDERETPEDYRARLEPMAAAGLPMICANPDLIVERGDRLIHCAGALAELYRGLGGAVEFAGKPHPPIYRRALARARAILGRERDVAPERVLAIGDAPRTDLAGARAMGFDALFIARGIHGEELFAEGVLDTGRLAGLLAADGVRPVGVQERLAW